MAIKVTFTDKELVHACKQGDILAYAEIMRRHQGMVNEEAIVFSSDKEEQAALVIRTFIHFWNNRDNISPGISLKEYFSKSIQEIAELQNA
jgi:hypothetical protein